MIMRPDPGGQQECKSDGMIDVIPVELWQAIVQDAGKKLDGQVDPALVPKDRLRRNIAFENRRLRADEIAQHRTGCQTGSDCLCYRVDAVERWGIE